MVRLPPFSTTTVSSIWLLRTTAPGATTCRLPVMCLPSITVLADLTSRSPPTVAIVTLDGTPTQTGVGWPDGQFLRLPGAPPAGAGGAPGAAMGAALVGDGRGGRGGLGEHVAGALRTGRGGRRWARHDGRRW